MFKNHSCNINQTDYYIRLILATLLLAYALYVYNTTFIIISLIIFATALKRYCIIYAIFNLNERYSAKNYYLTLLPKHNPSAVFIFDAEGKVVYENKSAKISMKNIKSIDDINLKNFQNIIQNSKKETMLHVEDNKSYKVQLEGIKKEKIILVYMTDVTEVLELNDAIEETQREVIYAMGEIGETRSKETGNHVKRVAMYSKQLALLYGLSEEEASLLKMASPMHDIGKVGIPDAILNAPRKLSVDEFEIMQTHASLGYEMLKNSNKPILKAAAIVANEHHEKYNGTGYPNNIKGEAIHIFGRITAVADVFDALGSERVYKKAWELDKILTLFKKESGEHFDPKLVKLFIENLDVFLEIRDEFKDV